MDFSKDKLLKEDTSFQVHLASHKWYELWSAEEICCCDEEVPSHVSFKSDEAEKKLLASSSGSNPLSTKMNAYLAYSFVDGPSRGSPSRWFARRPDSLEDMGHLYLEDKTFFIPNLPRHNVIGLQVHAYHVSVIDCIADILAHGLDLDTINAGSAAVSWFPAFQKNS
jgi:hypothetical protein